MAEFTEKDSKEMGIKLPLLNEWENIMDALWIQANKDSKLKPKQGTNEIIINKYKLGAYFINNSYLEVTVMEGDDDILRLRHKNINQTKKVIKSFFSK